MSALRETMMLDAALVYIAHDVPVFPVYGIRGGRCACGNLQCDNVGKHPLGRLVPHGLHDATTDAGQVRAWWTAEPTANIGLRAGAPFFVLDVDPRHAGDETLRALELELGPLPETAEVLTGGGGRHLYFAQVPGLGNSTAKLGAGIDTRGEGGYVLAPPSSHESGRVYTDEVKHALFDTPLAALPEAWVRRLRAPVAMNGAAAHGAGGDWAALLPGVAEGSRHADAARLAGHYLGKRLDPAEVEGLVVDFAGRCTPPLDPAEARTIVRDLAAKDARAREPVAAPSGNPAVLWARGRALYQRVARPVAHLIEGLIPAVGTVLVTGEDKSGKSTVAVLLMLSYLHGAPFLGRAVPRPGRAILVSEEDDADELRDRVRALHQGLALAYPDLVAAPDDPAGLALVEDRLVWEARAGLRLDDPAMLADLVVQITTLRDREPDGPAVLVLIDSLQAVRGLLDPGKSEGVATLKLVLRQIAAAGAVVLLIAHARKVVSGGKRTSRASQEVAANHELAAEAAATIGLMAMGPRADAPVRVDLVTKRGKSQTVGYLRIAYTPETWPPDLITITVEAAPSGDARAEASDAKVLAALPDAPAPGACVEALKTATKLGDRTVRRALDRLLAANKCLVTGVTTKQAKLYARAINASA